MAIPNVTPYSGQKPVPGQDQPTFNQNMSDELDYFNALPAELNSAIDAMNQTATDVDDAKAAAEAAASEAENSAVKADLAADAAGYKGEWYADAPVELGDIWGYEGSEWRSLTGADVEPVEGLDWRSINDHSNLTNRDEQGAHPASAIQARAGRSVLAKLDEAVSIKDFGGICDGSPNKASLWVSQGKYSSLAEIQVDYPTATSLDDYIDTLAIEKALAHLGNSGSLKLVGEPVFSRSVKFPSEANGLCIYADYVLLAKFEHTGDGFNLSLVNENVGKNVLRNIWVIGPDPVFFPAGYVSVSQGAGVKVRRAYDNTFENVYCIGFDKGFDLETGFNNKCVGFCGAVGNNYGVVITGGATNLNCFDKTKIRLNRKRGVLISGRAGGPYPTKNSFKDAYIETNVPWVAGQGYLPPPGDGSHSVGVELERAYGNDFSGVYYENQDFDIILTGASSYNKFKSDRHAPGFDDHIRAGKIWLKGVDVNGNDFTGSEWGSWDNTTASVISDNAHQLGNIFADTVGYNFKPSEMACFNNTILRNNQLYLGVHGTRIAAITRDPAGYYNNPSEGGLETQAPTITGIGTANATLNAKGCGEIILGTTITAPTTITNISGLRRGQIFVLSNYQTAHPVTIQSGSDGINGLVLNGRQSCILKEYSDCIVFQVSGMGKIVEVARNLQSEKRFPITQGTFTPSLQKSGGAVPPQSGFGRWRQDGNVVQVWIDTSFNEAQFEDAYYEVVIPFTNARTNNVTVGSGGSAGKTFNVTAQGGGRLRIYTEGSLTTISLQVTLFV